MFIKTDEPIGTEERMYVLVIDYRPDYGCPDVSGPYGTVEEAQRDAERIRRDVLGLEWVEATPENNEMWTDAGWYFGITEVGALEKRFASIDG